MSNVTVSIAGRSYTVACGAGEEEHIAMLGRSIDGKLADIPNLSSQSEARTLLFAALLLADELHEARAGEAPPAAGEEDTAEALEMLAGRLEMLAGKLENAGASA
jgi:cell division protein ZapA